MPPRQRARPAPIAKQDTSAVTTAPPGNSAPSQEIAAMKLIRKHARVEQGAVPSGATLDRRAFLKRSGLTVGGTALASTLPLGMMRRAEAQDDARHSGAKVERKRSVCTHCSVGCGIIAEVQNGVWTGQE